jgi:hypothetical protein
MDSARSERQYPYRARLVVDVTFRAPENRTAFAQQVALANALERCARGFATNVEHVEVLPTERRLYAEWER